MKKLTKATGIVGIIVISLCAIVFGLFSTTAHAFTDNLSMTERELYNATNTYNANDECFNANGKVDSITVDYRVTDKEQYHISYDMSAKNNNRVMSTTQVTVLTHGLGGSARHWSNNFSESNYEDDNVKFAYDSKSLISRIDGEVGGANIYWAVVGNYGEENKNASDEEKEEYTFHLYDITDQKTEAQVYDKSNEIEHITDASKHIIVVFEAYTPLGSNDNIYYQFNYMMSRVAYDLKALNGGLLPKFNLVGHSRGGTTNLQYALDHPDMVDSLVSLGTPYFSSTTANLFGEIYMKGKNDGLDDILDPELFYGYNNRWNDNYDALYSNINAHAIGSYHTFSSLIDAMSHTYGEETLPDWSKPMISIALAYANAAMFMPIKNELPPQKLFAHLGAVLDYLFPKDKVVDIFEIWGKEIAYDALPSFVAWRSDLLVPLESQLALDAGAAGHGGLSYTGFKRHIRPFVGLDADYEKVADPAPPVGHNLETRDSTIINNVLSVLNFGVSGFMFKETEGGTAKITGYRGAFESDNLIIPDTIDGKTVTEIDRFAFFGMEKSGIETITLPDTVETIGTYAFSDFTDVREIRLGASSKLRTVEAGAFNNCSALQTFTVPRSVEYIRGNAFLSCGELTNVYVADGNAHYSSVNGVLYNIDKGVLIYYPQGKTDAEYTVVPTCTEIGYYAFVGNPNLTTLNLNNVVTIREYGVSNCVALRSVGADKLDFVETGVFGKTAVFDGMDGEFISLGNVLFGYNGDAEDLTIDGKYVSTAPFAFAGNEKLETVRFLGNRLRLIGDNAFYGCDNLKSVYICNMNEAVGVSPSVFVANVEKIYVPELMKAEYDAHENWECYRDKISVHTTNMAFESNGGGEYPNMSAAYGGYIGEMPEPTRDGYTFEGWYLDADHSGTAIRQSDIWQDLSDDMTVYAKWAARQYSAVFVVDIDTGVSDSDLDRTYTVEDDVAFGIPKKRGYKFDGWYFDKEFAQFAGNGFARGETGDKIYYAKWTALKVAVKLDVNDTETYPADIAETDYTVEYDRADYAFAVPQRKGFSFNGWYAEADGQKLFVTGENGQSIKVWDLADENVTLYADWTRNKYYIKINSDGSIVWLGEDGFTENKTPIEFGTVFDTVDKMEAAFNSQKIGYKEGHKFEYFMLDGERFRLWESIDNRVRADDIIEIDAYFVKEINFTVNFSGFDLNDENPFRGEYGAEIRYLSVDKIGYTFKHWVVSDSIHNQRFVGTILAPGTVFDYTHMPDLSIGYEEDGTPIYLEAVFVANKYTVDFVTSRGVAPSSVRITFDELRTFPTVAVDGYEFLCWETVDGRAITDADGLMSVAWDIPADTTLHAKWKIIEYTITYVLNGGINNSGNVTKYTVESNTVYLCDPVRTGYRFMGWFEDPGFSKRITAVLHGSCENKTVYAKWAKIYTLTFNSNGGTSVSSISGITGDEVTLPSPTKSGYKGTWEYWGYLTGDGTVSNFGKEYVIGNGNVTLTAQWKQHIFTVKLNQNGGTGGTSEVIATFGLPMPNAIAPQKYGYQFCGYYFDGTEYYTDNMTSAKDWDIEENTTLFARWAPKTYLVHFDKCGGTGGTSSITVLFDSTLTFSQRKAPTKEYCTFLGYYTKPNGEGEQFLNANMDIVNPWKIAGGGTVYAHWLEPNTGSCVARGTLITLADGRQVPVESLSGKELLLVWNMETGAFDAAPIMFIDSEPTGYYEVIKLSFSDGTVSKIISEHGFWDTDLDQYVYLDKNAARYIGHRFLKQSGNGMTAVTLTGVEISTEMTAAYSPVTYGHLCYYVDGMLSMPGGISGLFNIFEVDGQTMTIDEQAYLSDIAKYGTFTYEEFAELYPVSEKVFEAFNGRYLKVAIGKGLITQERIGELIERYSEFF